MNVLFLMGVVMAVVMTGKADAARAATVRIGPNREMRVDGCPFFPLFVWLQPPELFDFHRSLGINTFMGEGAKEGVSTRTFLDEARARGAWGIVHATEENFALKDHPALLAWMFRDEPDMELRKEPPDSGHATPRVPPEEILGQYRRLKARDTTHPVYLNLTSRFLPRFRRIAPDRYGAYCAATDIVGYDLYPVAGWGRPEWISLLADATDSLRHIAKDRIPVWVIVECTTKLRWVSNERLEEIQHPMGARDDEVRAMVWMAIIHGAKGIGYFPHRWEPYRWSDISEEVQAEMKRTNAQISALAPVLLSPDVEDVVAADAGDGRVDIMAKRDGDRLYVFAVNMNPKPTDVTFRILDDLSDGSVEVYDENRSLPVRVGTFADRFDEYEVHIYWRVSYIRSPSGRSQESEFRSQESEFRSQESEFRSQNEERSGFWILDSGFWILDSGFWILDSGFCWRRVGMNF